MWSAFGNELRAYDKASGQLVWKSQLPAGATGAVMTYMHAGKQFILLPIGSRTHAGEFVAFSLP